jgi:hypothetical protein
MKPYDQIPYTNKLGQVIQPGERALVVTGGRGSTINTYDGVYLGCRPYTPYWKTTEPQFEIVAQVRDRFFSYFDKTTGDKVQWDSPNSEGRWYEGWRTTTIWSGRIFKLG